MAVPSPRSFADAASFRAWLEKNHARVDELILRCFKVHARDRGVTYPEAVNEALCYGWIDGVRRALDADSFTVRFSPRRAKSIWSAVNRRRVAVLEREGRMAPPGLAAWAKRDEAPSRRYSFENKPRAFSPELAKRLAADRAAAAFFAAQPPWYRRTIRFWVMSAAREETRLRRLERLLDYSRRGKPIPQLDRTPKKSAARRPSKEGKKR